MLMSGKNKPAQRVKIDQNAFETITYYYIIYLLGFETQ